MMRSARRVLIVSREVPPAVGPHPIRVAKLAKYLPEFGWEPTILTTPIDHAWAVDFTLTADLEGVAVIRAPRLLSRLVPPTAPDRDSNGSMNARDDGAATGVTRRVEAGSRRSRLARSVLIPDPSVLWAIPAARHAVTVASEFDAILTTAPPFSTHLVGLWVTKRSGLPWVAEYRDNWTMNPLYRRGRIGQAVNSYLERRFVRAASSIDVVSDAAAIEMEDTFGGLNAKLFVARNGFDPDDLPVSSERPTVFELAYAGSLDERRNPLPLFDALAALAASDGAFGAALRLRLMGNVADWVADSARNTLGNARVSVDGMLPHGEALRRASRAAVLVAITTRAEAGGAGLTSKLFEYLGLRRPVLILAPDGPARRLVTSLHAGGAADPDDPESIRSAVKQLYADWIAGAERTADPDGLQPYTRRGTAANVASALDASLRRPNRRRSAHDQ